MQRQMDYISIPFYVIWDLQYLVSAGCFQSQTTSDLRNLTPLYLICKRSWKESQPVFIFTKNILLCISIQSRGGGLSNADEPVKDFLLRSSEAAFPKPSAKCGEFPTASVVWFLWALTCLILNEIIEVVVLLWAAAIFTDPGPPADEERNKWSVLYVFSNGLEIVKRYFVCTWNSGSKGHIDISVRQSIHKAILSYISCCVQLFSLDRIKIRGSKERRYFTTVF